VSSRLSHLECSRCGLIYSAHEIQQRCGCGGALLVRYDLTHVDLASVRARPSGLWRYNELLPVLGDPIGLGETETALLFLPRLSERLGVETWLKDEGALPGGTFKARGACVALSRAVELGVKSIVLNTAGNAGGTWSLYAARAGLEITVTMAESAPKANQAEVRIAGGTLELVDGSIADAGRRAIEIAAEAGAFLAMTFYEPYRLEGKKTAFLEIFDRFGDADGMKMPRTLIMPVGGGVAAIAAAKTADEVRAAGWTVDEPPRIVGVQAANCAPIVTAFEAGESEVRAWEGDPMTIAAGLRVPAPIEGTLVLEHVRASGGSMVAVSEDAIRAAIGDLASNEGVFACPEGAATVAAALELAKRDELDGPVVLYNTGSGAKYIDVLL
jgi:threonine synthase